MSADKPKIIAVMPAYNAEATLERTLRDIPPGTVDEIILVDDCSRDRTVEVATTLGLTVIRHQKNTGYGGNQKTCYTEALERGADIVVMIHPDYQYDSRVIPIAAELIRLGNVDVILGSRIRTRAEALEGGMPAWKYIANRALTGLENWVFGLTLAEYHTGYRAYRREALEAVNVEMNSDNFVFDQDIVAQFVEAGLRIIEVPVPTRYFPEASSASFIQSSIYGCSILVVLCRYLMHKTGIRHSRQFDSLQQRYQNRDASTEATTQRTR